MHIEKLFHKNSFSGTPFLHANVSKLFSNKLSEHLYFKVDTFLKSEANIHALEQEFFDKKNRINQLTPNITYRRDRWEKLGVDLDLYHDLQYKIAAQKDRIFQLYQQSRYAEKYYLDMVFAFTPPNTCYQKHFDHVSKCWTLAYFIYPHKNVGTVLYDITRQKSYESSWHLNSGIAFCPKDHVTWHSYYNPLPGQYRVALVINIVRREDRPDMN